MNVSHQNLDGLNAILTVEITEQDYKEKVEKALENYRKNANIPGFRKGKVPAGLVRKQYLRPITIDEVNKLLQDAVFNYLTNEKLDILGNPLPVEQTNINWDTQKEFAFQFELGLTPEIDVTVPADATLDYMKIVADANAVNDYANSLASRYGKMSTPETPEAADLFNGDFVEIAEDGSDKEGGIVQNATFRGTDIDQPHVLEALLKLKEGEEMLIDANTDFQASHDVAKMLKATAEDVKKSFRLRFTLKAISRLTPHPFDQELFDKVFGEGVVSTEEEFRSRLKAQIEASYAGHGDSDLFHHAYHWFIENIQFNLPESFLKKWLRTAGEKPLSADEVEEQFPASINALRWQLIENRLIRSNNISVSHDELKAYAENTMRDRFAQYGLNITDEDAEKYGQNLLKNREEAERMNDQVYNQKLVAYFKEAFTLNTKEVTIDEFYAHQAEHKH
jgi:trigger factor